MKNAAAKVNRNFANTVVEMEYLIVERAKKIFAGMTPNVICHNARMAKNLVVGTFFLANENIIFHNKKAQRTVNQRMLSIMCKEGLANTNQESPFDVKLYHPIDICVDSSTGKLQVVEGNHRLEFSRQVFSEMAEKGQLYIVCRYIGVMTVAEQARYFRCSSHARSQLTQRQDFSVCIMEGNTMANTIVDLAEKNGFTVDYGQLGKEEKSRLTHSATLLRCRDTMKRIIVKYGGNDTLEKTLQFLSIIKNRTTDSLYCSVVEGIGLFFYKAVETRNFDMSHMMHSFSGLRNSEFIAKVKKCKGESVRGNDAKASAKALLEIYNDNCSHWTKKLKITF